uniref:Uncharacterized protein n=1 Tax=Knipowitschia caucasica TaxID=637954 RepID=A0AAV2LCH8_KNICA
MFPDVARRWRSKIKVPGCGIPQTWSSTSAGGGPPSHGPRREEEESFQCKKKNSWMLEECHARILEACENANRKMKEKMLCLESALKTMMEQKVKVKSGQR